MLKTSLTNRALLAHSKAPLAAVAVEPGQALTRLAHKHAPHPQAHERAVVQVRDSFLLPNDIYIMLAKEYKAQLS